jgi:hypothetical protein
MAARSVRWSGDYIVVWSDCSWDFFRCCRCGQPLEDPASRERGLGPGCVRHAALDEVFSVKRAERQRMREWRDGPRTPIRCGGASPEAQTPTSLIAAALTGEPSAVDRCRRPRGRVRAARARGRRRAERHRRRPTALERTHGRAALPRRPWTLRCPRMFIGGCLAVARRGQREGSDDTLANVGRGTAARVASQPRRRRARRARSASTA